MPQYLVNYGGVDYECKTWQEALQQAKTLVNTISVDPSCMSILSVMRHNSQDLCESTGSVAIYRVIKKECVEPILIVYVA